MYLSGRSGSLGAALIPPFQSFKGSAGKSPRNYNVIPVRSPVLRRVFGFREAKPWAIGRGYVCMHVPLGLYAARRNVRHSRLLALCASSHHSLCTTDREPRASPSIASSIITFPTSRALEAQREIYV